VKVVDAGVVVGLIVGDADPGLLGDDDLAAPHLLDSEVIHVLRRLVLRDVLSEEQGAAALDGFAALRIRRYPAEWMRSRIWELRHNLSAYDATYVALAELTDAAALLTTDARLANAPGVRCAVQVL
jgi:predicted nucleic acid-binding protein